ncbi:MAG TPA: YggS family pyridoxal phosphate-dependent enzyme, partial [Verrucomicrobiae bacterium]|nr:YggS family pyridoxal phosphate-dependent enzyme [Verrucomicrobiae bacterium]
MSVAADLQAVLDRIAAAAARAGRDREGVRLVAVSKKQPAAAVEEASRAGQRIFGENYV